MSNQPDNGFVTTNLFWRVINDLKKAISGAGVFSVSGWQVDNTDPSNPVIDQPAASDIDNDSTVAGAKVSDALDWLKNNAGAGVITGTYAVIKDLADNGNLIQGAQYFITDRPDPTGTGILMKAIDANNLEPACTGLFYVADFANIDIWDFSGDVTVTNGQPRATFNISNQSGVFLVGTLLTGDQNASTAIVVDDSDQNALVVAVVSGDWSTETSFTDENAETADIDSTVAGTFVTGQQVSVLNGYITALSGNGLTPVTMTIKYNEASDLAGQTNPLLTLTNGAQFYVIDQSLGTILVTTTVQQPVLDEVAIWNNRHYKAFTTLDNSVAISCISPDNDPANWTLLDKDDATNPMVIVADAITYDIIQDEISSRKHFNSNKEVQYVGSDYDTVDIDWGNPNVIANINSSVGGISILNAMGVCRVAIYGSAYGNYRFISAALTEINLFGYGSVDVSWNTGLGSINFTGTDVANSFIYRNSGGISISKTYGYIQLQNNSSLFKDYTNSTAIEVNGSTDEIEIYGLGGLAVINNNSGEQYMTLGVESVIESDNNSGDQSITATNDSHVVAHDNSGNQKLNADTFSTITANSNSSTQEYSALSFSDIMDNNNSTPKHEVRINGYPMIQYLPPDGDGSSLTGITAGQIGGLGTAATTDATDYATAAQGATADTALQPNGQNGTIDAAAVTGGVSVADGLVTGGLS